MKRILLVDDEAKLRSAIRRMLEPLGLEIEEAADGYEALRSYRSCHAELVICDVFMPDKDGLELISVLKKEFDEVKILAISGGGFDGTMDLLPTALHFGATEILQKPFKQEDLLEKVKALLEQ
ncbi:response regulator [Telmatocola sphagniphila]|uniref:Response regulator n=1 Tax=Telmatocola sphagniphila TaxID=1123043 RepID=A0A8E6B8I9_9BACT|nr:response regulator [Telmatocola sphagniphila]QVL33853.1 response regulator [Telmatocola sphagniphila]